MGEEKKDLADRVAQLTPGQAKKLERWMISQHMCKRSACSALVLCWLIDGKSKAGERVVITSDNLPGALATLVQSLSEEHQKSIGEKLQELEQESSLPPQER